MDGLSFLFGILTLLLLLAVVGMNLANSSHREEAFVDSGNSGKSGKSGNSGKIGSLERSEIEEQIRATLDPMAFYTVPDGTRTSDGEALCIVISLIRSSMADNEALGQTLSNAEISKRVEAQLSTAIPGGVLPCPLLQYPSHSATDLEWLSWLQTVPSDFGARVVLMAAYADKTITSVANKMKEALSGGITIPSLQGFVDVCTPTLAEKKRSDLAEQTCTLPESLTAAEIKEAVTKLLSTLVTEKARILAKAATTNALTLDLKTDVHTHIMNSMVAADYLNKQKQSLEAGNLPTISSSSS